MNNELNDQAMESVSGGRVPESQRPNALNRAEHVCFDCNLHKHNECAYGPSGLADVLLEKGITSINNFSHCPFYLE